MEANNNKEVCMVGLQQIMVKKVAWLDGWMEANNSKECCMVGWKQIMAKNAACLDGCN